MLHLLAGAVTARLYARSDPKLAFDESLLKTDNSDSTFWLQAYKAAVFS